MINYSFIIPHKNRPDLLKRCVDSIPERNDVQIIVIDDNSSIDKKPTIRRTGCEVILLTAEQSKGAGRARNVGLKHAKGKWLLFADADDYYNEGFLDVLDTYKGEKYDVVYFNFEYKDGVTGETLPPLRWRRIITEYDGSKDAQESIRFRNKVPWTKMVCHEYLTRYNIIFEEVPNGNDILFSFMVGCHTENIAVETQPIYVYLRNDNSILTKKPSAKDALCKLTHRVKLNSVYYDLGHSEWRGSVVRLIFHYTWEVGIPFVHLLLLNSYKLYRYRNEWIDMARNNTRK